MQYLSDEFDFPISTKAFTYLRDAVNFYINDTNRHDLQYVINQLAKKYNVSPPAISMGLFRCIDKGVEYKVKVTNNYANIYRELGIKEIIYRLAETCKAEGRDF